MSYTLAIRCNDCGMVSWNPGDVSHLYCAKCGKFHDGAPPAPQFDERQRLIERIASLEEQLSDSETWRATWAFRAGIASGVASRYSKTAITEIAELCGEPSKTGAVDDTKN